jgi:hypothetical protein
VDSMPSQSAPDTAPAAHDPDTREIYRALLIRSLSPSEAANLTAFLCGIPVGRQPWKIHEVNRLLFLREMYKAGQFRPTRGA